MLRARACVLGVVCLLITALGAVAVADRAGLAQGGRVYTVAQVFALLQHNPKAWVGRTVLIRGVLWRQMAECRRPGGCAFPPGLGLKCATPMRCKFAIWSFIAGANGLDLEAGRWLYVPYKPDERATLKPIFMTLSGIPGVGPLIADYGFTQVFKVRLLKPAQCPPTTYGSDSGVPCAFDAKWA
jgi:hypothetical protein